jgi:hypothetical protein
MKRAIRITSITAMIQSIVRCVAMTLTLLTIAASAQITPSDDTYISSTMPTTNYGAATSITVQNPATTGLIRFDLSSIPSTFTSTNVSKATLKKY